MHALGLIQSQEYSNSPAEVQEALAAAAEREGAWKSEREETEQLVRDIAGREKEAEARDRAHEREKELAHELAAGLREQV